MRTVYLDMDGMTIEELTAVAREGAILRLSPAAERRIADGRALVDQWVSEERRIYGVTTGFGALSDVAISKKDTRRLQENILMSHAAGVGAPLDAEIVRAAMALRVKDFARGHSGIRLATARHLLELLNVGIAPVVPEKGSVGASGDLVPLARERGTGILAMKALADGYLYRSPGPALRYALALPVASVVVGANSPAMLKTDIEIARSWTAMNGAEREELFLSAPELGDYVCRLCGRCREEGFDPQQVFLLEGLFDRQMDDGRVDDAARYALRERLKGWFGQADAAREEYAALAAKVDPGRDYRYLNERCPYGIDVDRKLKLAHGKLSRERYVP